MDFVGVSFWEILIVLVVALLAVGPQRLPEIALKLGKAVRRLKMASSELTRNINEEINRDTSDLEDIGKETSEISAEIKTIGKADVENSVLPPHSSKEKEPNQ